MPRMVEYTPLIDKLLEKTRQRKVEWKGTYESSTFICVLEGEYSFEIEKGKYSSGSWFRRLTMRDKEAEEVFVMRAVDPGAATSMENDELFATLEELYNRARTVALNIDRKVEAASNILDKI
jgi:hypothetical protein